VSIGHFQLKRDPSFIEPIKGKEMMEFHCGFRRFQARPIYTQDVGKQADKSKVERYFQPERFTVASAYCRVMFPPAAVLMFKPADSHCSVPRLVAAGKFMGMDADRLLVKRVVLTGSVLVFQ
jgi:pre-rRNA-processing protein TSR1